MRPVSALLIVGSALCLVLILTLAGIHKRLARHDQPQGDAGAG